MQENSASSSKWPCLKHGDDEAAMSISAAAAEMWHSEVGETHPHGDLERIRGLDHSRSDNGADTRATTWSGMMTV
jgi:hypothetical protein